jgi:hypothetical protein
MTFPAKTVEEPAPGVDGEATIKSFVGVVLGRSDISIRVRITVAVGNKADIFLARRTIFSLRRSNRKYIFFLPFLER